MTVTISRRRRGRRGTTLVVLGLALLATALFVTAVALDGDGGTDTLTLAREVGHNLLHLRWPFALVVLALTVAHYLATAVAARAAAGVDLDYPELVRVQLAAAAANRITPGGIGGSALTARYLTRRGLPVAGAAGTVTMLAVLGAFADLVVLVVIVAVGGWLRLGGGSGEFTRVADHVSAVLGPVRSPWLWSVVGALIGLVVVVALTRRRHRLRPAIAGFWTPTRAIATCPTRLATLLGASGTTTLVMGFAFVAATRLLPGPTPHGGLGAVLVAYMLGAAAGSSVPVPAGLGSTEAALVAVLVGLHVPAAHAVQVVFVYRIITFWLPAAIGVVVTRGLRRAGAL